MTAERTWAWIVALRTELIDQLSELPAEQWDTPSLCPGWRVRDVVAHTIPHERFTAPGGLVGLARAGLSLQRSIHIDAVRRGSAPLEDLIAAYRAGIDRRSVPPRREPQHLLDDLFIHAQDIRRPLSLRCPSGSPSCDPAVLVALAQKVSTDPVLGAPSRIKGLRLTATDVDWSVGDGEEVTGAAEALILAMSGREVVLPELVGPGVARLAATR